jgi:hypothetical protein
MNDSGKELFSREAAEFPAEKKDVHVLHLP